MFYEDIFSALRRKEVDFVVVGGLAVVLHGIVRLTADLDLVIALEKENLEKFAQAMKEMGYLPKVPASVIDLCSAEKRQEWIKKKNMKVFSFFHQKDHYKSVDVFIIEPIPFKLLNRDKKIVKAGKVEIPICSIEHLISLKKKAGRPQDLADIKALKKLEK